MEGSTYTHNLITDFKKGDKIKKGDVVSYHEDFFERDWLYKGKPVSKTTTMATVALTHNNEVYEDSSAVSAKFAERLTTEIVQRRKFILDFNTNIINILNVGSEVTPNDILFTGLDQETDGSNLSEQSLAMLQNLASLSPRARHEGILDSIEIKYNGSKSDMSPSLRTLANRLDTELSNKTRGTAYHATNNQVGREYRSSGKSLELDTLELIFNIRTPLGLGVGDKLVFANNIKSVIGDVWDGTIKTESGDEVDAQTGYLGIIGRIVNSPIDIGTTAKLLRLRGKQIAEDYFSK